MSAIHKAHADVRALPVAHFERDRVKMLHAADKYLTHSLSEGRLQHENAAELVADGALSSIYVDAEDIYRGVRELLHGIDDGTVSPEQAVSSLEAISKRAAVARATAAAAQELRIHLNNGNWAYALKLARQFDTERGV